MITTAPTAAPARSTEQLLASHRDQMLLVSMVVKSPDYRIVMQKGQVVARTADGQHRPVDGRHATRSRWKWNQHPLFDAVRANGQRAGEVLSFYSVPGPDGLRMMPQESFGPFENALEPLCDQREALVAQIQDRWHDEILPALESFHGDVFYQIAPYLPDPESLAGRYRILRTFLRLTATDPRNLRLESLTASQQHQAIERQRARIDRMYRERFGALFDNVFGQVVATCEDLIHGPLDPQTGRRDPQKSLQSGHRRSSSLDRVLGTLERLGQFSQFTSPEVMAKVHAAHRLVSRCTIDQINADGGRNPVSEAVVAAMSELNDAARSLWQTRRRALRQIDF